MSLATIILSVILGGVLPAGEAFLNPLGKRDSILIADRVEYGFTLEGVRRDAVFALPDWSKLSNDTLTVVRPWQLDTLKKDKKKGTADLRGSVILAAFEEGTYELPPVFVLRRQGEQIDTLEFKPCKMEVKDVAIDTAGFQVRPIKGLIRYPITFREVLPWALGGLLAAGIIAAGIILIIRYRRRRQGEDVHRDPPHIVALRQLDKYRSDKYWAPDRQKAFYSGVTDTLKEYIDARFGVDAPEMTTAELFAALARDCPELEAPLREELKAMFERADFVKFAKYIAPDEDNAAVLPLSVRFVTSTYQSELEEEQAKNAV